MTFGSKVLVLHQERGGKHSPKGRSMVRGGKTKGDKTKFARSLIQDKGRPSAPKARRPRCGARRDSPTKGINVCKREGRTEKKKKDERSCTPRAFVRGSSARSTCQASAKKGGQKKWGNEKGTWEKRGARRPRKATQNQCMAWTGTGVRTPPKKGKERAWANAKEKDFGRLPKKKEPSC